MVLLLAFALVPVITFEVISLMEMNQASNDIQGKVSDLSNTLNRSALTTASNEADQVQIAMAKARQYDELFGRVRSENEIVANDASDSRDNQSCEVQAGIWIAPLGANETLLAKMKGTLSSLCAPTTILHSVIEAEPLASLGYIGTEDGVLATWPNIDDELLKKAPFDHRKTSWYITAKNIGKTTWTKPYTDSRGSLAITCLTPIRRGDRMFGVAGMNISLASVSNDLTTLGGRGYPFIIDESGSVLMRPSASPRGQLVHLFDSENFYESNSSEIRELVRNMLHGETGSAVIGLEKGDGYVAYAPITTLGWSFGIAYPVEEMSLPARFIDAGIKDTAKGVTQGLTDAVRVTWESALAVVIVACFVAGASGFLISRRVESQARNIAQVADRIRNGDLDIPEVSSVDLGFMGCALSGLSEGIKQYLTEHVATAESLGSSKKELEILGEIKRSLGPGPGDIPQPKGYEIAAFSVPSVDGGFDFYNVTDVGEDKIALSMAEVPGDGITGAILAVASRALIRSASRNDDPSKVLSDVNLQISGSVQGMSLSCFYAVLDTASHTLEFVNAGFNPAFIIDSGGSVDTLGGGGIALGVLDRLDLKSERIPVQPGDVLMVYSDGVTEAINAWRPQQGAERLITVLKENRLLSVQEILGAIEKEMRSHLKDHPLKDDSTLVILKRL